MLDPVINGVKQCLEKQASASYKEKQASGLSDRARNLAIGGLSALAGGIGGYKLGDSDVSDKNKSLITSGVLGSLGLGAGATAIAAPGSSATSAVTSGMGGFTLGSLLGKALGEKMKTTRDNNELLAQEEAQSGLAQDVDPSSYYSMYNNYGGSPYGQYQDPYANYYQYL